MTKFAESNQLQYSTRVAPTKQSPTMFWPILGTKYIVTTGQVNIEN
jgi:hypothetical protein